MLISTCLSKHENSVVLSCTFRSNPSFKRFFHDSSGRKIFQIIIAYWEPAWLILKIYGKENFLKLLTHVDHSNLRTVFLQTPNTSYSYRFRNSRIPLFRHFMDSLKNPPTMAQSSFICKQKHLLVVTFPIFG